MDSPITKQVKALLKDRCDDYIAAKNALEPRSFADSHSYYASSLELSSKAESYLAVYESLTSEAYESIFEEEE